MKHILAFAAQTIAVSLALPVLAQDAPTPLYVVSILASDTQSASELASAYK